MVYREINDMKQRALQLLEEGWEISEIATVIDRRSNHYETHGRVDPPSVSRGRRHIFK